MKSLAALIVPAILLLPSDPGGKVEWFRDVEKGAFRARLEQRAVFLYFVDAECVVCKGLDTGAFSSDEVLKAAAGVIPILVDCTKAADHEILKKKFSVTGYPTLIVTDPELVQIEEITSKTPPDIAGSLAAAVKKHPGTPCLWARTSEAATEAAKTDRKPLVVYVHDAKTDLVKITPKVMKDLGFRVEKCAWTEATATMEDKDPLKAKYGYTSLPCWVILDARDLAKKPLGAIEVYESDKAETTNKYLDKALAKFKK